MTTSKLVLGAVAAVIATVSTAHAATTPSTATLDKTSGAESRVSNAAREQILGKSHLQLALKRPKPFVQESGPTFVQWRGQVKTQTDELRPAPAGDVLLVLEQSRARIS